MVRSMGAAPAPWIRHCYISEMVEGRWVHAARRLTSIKFSFGPCNIYRDGPRGVGYPADARSVGDSHPSCYKIVQQNNLGDVANSIPHYVHIFDSRNSKTIIKIVLKSSHVWQSCARNKNGSVLTHSINYTLCEEECLETALKGIGVGGQPRGKSFQTVGARWPKDLLPNTVEIYIATRSTNCHS